jgi:LPS-assembly lipoprotein
MSWPRIWSSLPLLTLVAGCGFHPLYVDDPEHPALAPQLAAIHVRQINDRYGQEMTNELRDAFDPHSSGTEQAYELSVALLETKADLLQRQDGTASRTDSSLTAQWSLTRLSDKKVVVSGTSRALTGHDVLPNEYANVVAINTDVTRAIHEVSAEIETRVAYYLQQPT